MIHAVHQEQEKCKRRLENLFFIFYFFLIYKDIEESVPNCDLYFTCRDVLLKQPFVAEPISASTPQIM